MSNKEYQAKYYQDNKERICIRNKKRRHANPVEMERLRECNKKYRVKYRTKRLAYQKTVNKRDWPLRKQMRKQISDYLWTYKSNHPCVDCDNSNPVVLEFDHVHGTKKFHMAKAIQYAFKTVFSEIEKCVIRCANCHRIRTYKLQHGGGANP